jgi:beta-glucosidase/6-phospho-beta-glucosidase/beta-galactosidase
VAGLFRSFWLGGFESAHHINQRGIRLDLVSATQHDVQVDEDYARLARHGFRTVREGMRWPLIDGGAGLDFSSVLPMLAAAERHGIEIIWSLCHYGWPEDIELYSPAFVERFARYAAAAARLIADRSDAVPFYNPINEISFFAWAAAEKGYIHPRERGNGARMKAQLVRAAIAAMEAIWAVDPRARMVHVDPLIHVLTPAGRPELARAAAEQRAAQFDAWDMLAGGLEPALGGHPRYLDVMGINYYHANQWEHPDQRLRWEDTPRDPRWMPLQLLLREVYYRYGRPLFVSETSHFGEGRGRWLREVAAEVHAARADNIPVEGICIYPIIDRPDWDEPDHWHNSGLWDLRRGEGDRLERVVCEDYLGELQRAQALLGSAGGTH